MRILAPRWGSCRRNFGRVPAENLLTLKPNPFSSAHDFDDGQVRAVENIIGFHCQLTHTSGIFVFAKRYPVPTIDLNEGDWHASFQVPVPVIDGRAVLCEVDFLVAYPDFELPVFETGPCYLHANIEVDLVPSDHSPLPGEIYYGDADDPVDGTVTCLDTPEDYDFRLLLTQGPVAADGHIWGTMKALYR